MLSLMELSLLFSLDSALHACVSHSGSARTEFASRFCELMIHTAQSLIGRLAHSTHGTVLSVGSAFAMCGKGAIVSVMTWTSEDDDADYIIQWSLEDAEFITESALSPFSHCEVNMATCDCRSPIALSMFCWKSVISSSLWSRIAKILR